MEVRQVRFSICLKAIVQWTWCLVCLHTSPRGQDLSCLLNSDDGVAHYEPGMRRRALTPIAGQNFVAKMQMSGRRALSLPRSQRFEGKKYSWHFSVICLETTPLTMSNALWAGMLACCMMTFSPKHKVVTASFIFL